MFGRREKIRLKRTGNGANASNVVQMIRLGERTNALLGTDDLKARVDRISKILNVDHKKTRSRRSDDVMEGWQYIRRMSLGTAGVDGVMMLDYC